MEPIAWLENGLLWIVKFRSSTSLLILHVIQFDDVGRRRQCLTKCGHVLCLECVNNVLEVRTGKLSSAPCPICRKGFSSKSVIPLFLWPLCAFYFVLQIYSRICDIGWNFHTTNERCTTKKIEFGRFNYLMWRIASHGLFLLLSD